MNIAFELDRVRRLVDDVKGLIIADREPVTAYKIYEGKLPGGETADCSAWEDFSTSTPWEGLEKHRWFRTTVTIPERFAGKRVDFLILTGREGQWDATNPQMLFYLDGKIIQGVDVNHHRVRITPAAEAGRSYEIAFIAFSGSVPGDLLLKTSLIVTDEATESTYYDLAVAYDSANLLHQSQSDDARRILLPLGAAADEIDLRTPYSENYYASLKRASDILGAAFYSEVDETAPVVSAIGHTHIDIAWLWTVSQTREKALRSFSTVLDLMDRYPDYKFMSSQPILYQFVKEQAPEIYERIKERVAEGRWETDGAMWLEADCNIPTGESLVRQIIKGRKFFKDEFGTESKALWLPDVFGYSGALPQILKKSGIPYFMTTKISWNKYNQLPNDTFLWKGIDGTDVFVYMPTACNYSTTLGAKVTFSDRLNSTTYTATVNPNMALGTYDRFQNKDLTEDTIMLFGHGDGGGGPTEEMLEYAKRLQYGIPGIPRVVIEREGDFFDRVYNTIADLPEMPTWNGELYFELHRGTYTSAARNKRNNRKSELLYEELETLSSMGSLWGLSTPREILRSGWDTILLNQFHDIIPGSSISDVYKTTDVEYEKILSDGQAAVDEKVSAIAGMVSADAPSALLVNTLGFTRSGVVTLPAPAEKIRAVSDNGREYPVQYADGSVSFFAQDIPAQGYKTVALVPGEAEASPAPAFDGRFENAYYAVSFEEDGTISSLVEKETGRELITSGKRGNALCTYEDRPANWDNWDLDDCYRRKPYEADSRTPLHVVEWGPVRCVLEHSCTFDRSTVTQKIVLYPDQPRIDFVTDADWQNNNVILRTSFPVDVNAVKASFEIQYGSVERETTRNMSWDDAKFEVCGHKWGDLSDNGAGLSLLNDCKYGYSAKDGSIGLTLIKAGSYPNTDNDLGAHHFTYSIYPHAGRWQEAQTVAQAYDLNQPVIGCYTEAKSGSLPAAFSLVSVGKKDCFVEVTKPAEERDSLMVRLYENGNKQIRDTAVLGFTPKAVYECDLVENRISPVETDGNTFSFTLKPFEIKTFEIVR